MNLTLQQKMSREWFVYALYDPTTKTVFYIGITCNAEQRFAAHASGSGAGRGRFAQIREAGAEPELIIIARSVDYLKAVEWENRLILEYQGRLINKNIHPER